MATFPRSLAIIAAAAAIIGRRAADGSRAMPLPRIAIATGDPAGIGPEIALKAAINADVRALCRPLLVGDPVAVDLHARSAGLSPALHVVEDATNADWTDGTVYLLDARDGGNAPMKFGTIDAAYGRASRARGAPSRPPWPVTLKPLTLRRRPNGR